MTAKSKTHLLFDADLGAIGIQLGVARAKLETVKGRRNERNFFDKVHRSFLCKTQDQNSAHSSGNQKRTQKKAHFALLLFNLHANSCAVRVTDRIAKVASIDADGGGGIRRSHGCCGVGTCGWIGANTKRTQMVLYATVEKKRRISRRAKGGKNKSFCCETVEKKRRIPRRAKGGKQEDPK